MRTADDTKHRHTCGARFIYRDKFGKVITREEAAKLGEHPTYRVIAQSELRTGWRVSTVWLLGIPHGLVVGLELYFETMVFGPKDEAGRYGWATLREAEEGHESVCRHWENPERDAEFRLVGSAADEEE